MEIDKLNERRIKSECSKLDTFQNINSALDRIEEKVDGLSSEMRVMIKLEQQQITHSKDIERLSKTVDDLRDQNRILSDRMLELRSNFESQSKSIGTFERIIWAGATVIGVIGGKYFFNIG
jgi:archaellum component FlaC